MVFLILISQFFAQVKSIAIEGYVLDKDIYSGDRYCIPYV
jgi:hypothetical protein